MRIDGDDWPGWSEHESQLRPVEANEHPSTRPRAVWTIAAEVIREPMFLMLVAAGDLDPEDGRARGRTHAARFRIRRNGDRIPSLALSLLAGVGSLLLLDVLRRVYSGAPRSCARLTDTECK
jgi:hypothetical protein